MPEKYWEQLTISFLIVAVGTAIAWVVNGSLRRRWHARRTYDTYVLGDGVVNSITINLDVKLSEAERRRILSEYGKVLSTYAPALNPNSALDAAGAAKKGEPRSTLVSRVLGSWHDSR